MLHLLFRVFLFLQIVFPGNFQDLIPWLVTPLVLGGVASWVINNWGAPGTDPTKQPGWTSRQKLVAKLLTYLVIGILDVVLQLIPANVLAEFAMPLSVILGVLAAFFGQAAFG